jgi:maltodextrin utilization protein YvdJ
MCNHKNLVKSLFLFALLTVPISVSGAESDSLTYVVKKLSQNP